MRIEYVIKSPTRHEIFSKEDLYKITSYLKANIDDPICFGCLLTLLTGLRVGELCALRYEDLDKQKKVLYINKTLQRIHDNQNMKQKTKIIVDTPKTFNAIREIPLPSFVVDFINDENKNKYLLTNSNLYIEPRVFYQKYKKLLAKIGVEYKKFHSLRHTFATFALKSNKMDLKTLSKILGHSKASFTLCEYTHTDLETKKEQLLAFYNYLDCVK